ncbi:MAG: SGNH/GDSL hydrolase family protein [Phycisphaeraceae bacterium]
MSGKYRIVTGLLVVLLGIGAAASDVRAVEVPAIAVFGDSLSDTGNLYDAVGGADIPFVLSWDDYYQGRFSNGPLWIEHLADRIVPNVGSASVQAVGLGGLNFAFGSAKTGSGTNFLGVPNMGTQVDSYLGALGGQSPGDTLFVVWGGANDLYAGTPFDSVAEDIAGHVARLAQQGGHQFLVPNLSPLGDLPLHINTTNRDELNTLTADFNAHLASELTLVRSDYDVTIHEFDISTLFQAVSADPQAYHDELSIVDQAALTGDPTQADQYLFWDELDDVSHPTRVGHALIAEAAYQTMIPEPGSVALLVTGVAALTLRRRGRVRA